MANSRPARTEQARGTLSFPPRPRHWQGDLLSAFDPAEIGKRDETKFFDARNSAETEVPYSSKASGTPPWG